MKKLFILLQYLVPQHGLSRLVGHLARSQHGWLKNTLISAFGWHFQVDMSEAQQSDPRQFSDFNGFFTRALREGARPICGDEHIASPSDGTISQIGSLRSGRILQAKGRSYSSTELLGGDPSLASLFDDGSFATIYLSPRDYHRVHMPSYGRLLKTVYVPGELFSVNQTTAEGVPNLFARNERLVCIFDTPLGPVASVMVGAMIVAGIETVWSGQEAPLTRQVKTTRYDEPAPEIILQRGEEMGRFMLGSTVILLFPQNTVRWLDNFNEGSTVRMGEALGLRI